MKKTYITPTVELIDVQTESHLLSISNEDTLGELEVGKGEVNESWSKSHSFDVWGFEEEED